MPNYFDSTTTQVQNMKNAPGVEQARQELKKKNAGKPWNEWQNLTNYPAHFGLKGLWNAGLNSTQQFVGSYRVDMFVNSNRTVDIILTNTTSFTSFSYGQGPSWDRGPGGSQTQIYFWRESW